MLETNRISELLESYIEYKHSLGFEIKQEISVLRNFQRYTLEKDYTGALTKNIVLEWISSGNQKYKTMGRKIEVLRPFMKYSSFFDSKTEVIYENIYPNVHARPVPYIISEHETLLLMEECKNLYSPDGIRSQTIKTVIGLLWTAGLRPSEATQLKIQDVDTTNNLIHIKNTKYNSERKIPIDPTVSIEIEKYKDFIFKKIGYKLENDPLFYTTGRKALSQQSMAYAFKIIRKCLNAHPLGYDHVRLYDFRHTMACRTIKKWLLNKENVNNSLFILSVYMGHKKPEDTYWYLSATPELLNIATEKYEEYFGGFDYE